MLNPIAMEDRYVLNKAKCWIISSILIFLFAAGVRVGFLALRGPAVSGDTPDYLILAHNILDHRAFSLSQSGPYEISIRRAPAYPVFLALTSPLHQWNLTNIALIQALLGAITALACMWIASRFLPRPYALATGLLISIHPGLIANCASILSEPLFTFLLVSSMALIVMSKLHRRTILAALGAIALGIAALCRPIASPLALIFALGLLGKDRSDWKTPGVVLLVFSLTIAPWVLRCSLPAGRLVLIQAHGQANFYLSTVNYEGSEEAELWRTFGQDPYAERLQASRTIPDILAADDWAFREAARRISESPVEYLKKRARSYPHLFLSSLDSITGFNQSFGQLMSQGNYFRISMKLFLLLLFSALPLLMGVIGLRGSGSRIVPLLCSSVWVYMLVIHLPMWIEYRFWIPALPFLTMSGMFGASLVMQYWNSHLRPKGPVSLGQGDAG